MKYLSTLPKVVLYLIPILFLQIVLSALNNHSTNQNLKKLETKINTLDSKITQLSSTSNESVLVAMNTLREEMVKYRAEQATQSQILGQSSDTYLLNNFQGLDSNNIATSSIGSQIGGLQNKQIRLKTDWKSADVFEKALASSKIIGQLNSNSNYLLVSKENTWFQIKLLDGQNGWVQSVFVDEINQ